jgi:hypothetical protein
MKLPRNKVIAFLRKEVSKPDKSILAIRKFPRFRGSLHWCCPVGLHQKCVNASDTIPHSTDAHKLFPEISVKTFERFMDWWDDLSLEQAKEAVDLIWN